MKKRPGATVSIVGVPLDSGAGASGARMGPNAIRCAGLAERLGQLGFFAKDEGDLPADYSFGRPVRRPNHMTKLNHLDYIVKINEQLCAKICKIAASGSFPLVLGGDHSIAIGTIGALKQQGGQYGLIWFDAHTDANTAETTPTGNIHGMSLAVALGYGDPRLTGIGGGGPSIKPEHTVIIGARSVDPGERELLRRLGINVFTVRDIERFGIGKVTERALKIAARGTDGIHLSFDLDVLDPGEAPGVGTPIPGGLSLREGLLAMELAARSQAVVSAEFVEVNPVFDCKNRTAAAAVELIGVLFGDTIM